jgi:hypothetical protein
MNQRNTSYEIEGFFRGQRQAALKASSPVGLGITHGLRGYKLDEAFVQARIRTVSDIEGLIHFLQNLAPNFTEEPEDPSIARKACIYRHTT